MSDKELDIKSPYIKNNIGSIDEIRKKIVKKTEKNGSLDDNFISLKERDVSDDLLRHKIEKIGKKIVGEEIKKFSEIASIEISKEFESLENKIYDEILITAEKDFARSIELERDIDEKIKTLNSTIKEMEIRLNDLELYSLNIKSEDAINKKRQNKNTLENINNIEDLDEENIYSLNINKKEDLKEESFDKNMQYEEEDNEAYIEEININEFNKDEEEDTYNQVENKKEEIKDEEKEYLKSKMEEIIKKFQKEGLFFKQNIFSTKYADLDAEHFLKNKDDYTDLNEEDNNKMYFTLINLMDKTEVDPEEDETIESFLKRMYLKKIKKQKISKIK